jgi:hypothetical protein
MAEHQVGLSETELRRAVRWELDTHRLPADPAGLASFLTDVLVKVVDANNAAIAAHLAQENEARTEGVY